MYDYSQHQNMDGFWGDVKRKIYKNKKLIKVLSAIYPPIGINATAAVKPVETAAVVATAGAAGYAGGASALAAKAQDYVAKAKEVKAAADAVRTAFKSPAVPATEYAPDYVPPNAPAAGSIDPILIAGGIAAAILLALRK